MPDTPKPQLDLSDEGLWRMAVDAVAESVNSSDMVNSTIARYFRSVRDQALDEGRANGLEEASQICEEDSQYVMQQRAKQIRRRYGSER
jgi:hypothetical protein